MTDLAKVFCDAVLANKNNGASIEAGFAAVRKAVLEEAARVAEAAGNTWSNTRIVEVALQEAAVDDKCVEIATAIRALAERTP